MRPNILKILFEMEMMSNLATVETTYKDVERGNNQRGGTGHLMSNAKRRKNRKNRK